MEQLTSAWILGQSLWGACALSLCIWLKVWRPSRVVGPDRPMMNQPLGTTWSMFIFVVLGWLIPPLLFGAPRGDGSPGGSSPLSTNDLIRTGLLSYAGALIALLFVTIPRHQPSRRGSFKPEQLGRGVIQGALGAIIVLPLIFWTGVATEIAYQHFAYEHPMEHEMLRSLLEASWTQQALLLASAVLLAPLVEELIFRGLLQTLLVKGLDRLAGAMVHRPDVANAAASTSPTSDDTPNLPEHRVWTRWLGIALASAAFASVHEPWSIPPIFVLSLCLGYIYERTGNLWSAITLHMLFNAASTAQFILTR